LTYSIIDRKLASSPSSLLTRFLCSIVAASIVVSSASARGCDALDPFVVKPFWGSCLFQLHQRFFETPVI
jgi:hypothetical protein